MNAVGIGGVPNSRMGGVYGGNVKELGAMLLLTLLALVVFTTFMLAIRKWFK